MCIRDRNIYDEYLQRAEELNENRNIVKNGDVLLASTGDGTLGKCCVYDKKFPAIADGHVTIIRVDKKVIDPYYLADYLRCGFGASQINRLYSGSTGLIELTPEQVDVILIDIMLDKEGVDIQKKKSKSIRNIEKKYQKQIEKAEKTLNNLMELRVALETYYQLTNSYPELTRDGVKDNLKLLDYINEKGELISFAQIYRHDSIPKTSGTEELLENNNVYDVSDFTKGNNNGGWNFDFSGHTGEIHANLPNNIYFQGINWCEY